MEHGYNSEMAIQILIALLKKHGIKKVIVSPGSTNITFVGSIQYDPYFEIFSCVDERSAAYMACGLAYESGEPVCISCTGATSSRNYMPGLTEAYYKKIPVIAITSTQHIGKVGQLVPQVIDRSTQPKDIVKLSVSLPFVLSDEDEWECEIKINNALLECRRHGGGPVHINLQTMYSKEYKTRILPNVRKISRFGITDNLPIMPNGKIAIYCGAHIKMNKTLINSIDEFCMHYNAVVFCDHTSGYYGKYKVLNEIVAFQGIRNENMPDLVIHLGEVSGAYGGSWKSKEVWRVSEDGNLKDPFKLLTNIFEMPEEVFFKKYIELSHYQVFDRNYYEECNFEVKQLRDKISDLPLCQFWIAKNTVEYIPKNSVIHFAILNSLRAWNFFELPDGVDSTCNVGGFGIDGNMSTLIGASLSNQKKIYFLVIGDLAFFYDLNSLGNRHIKNNVRILLINNGKGTQFTSYNSMGYLEFGKDADNFIAAKGHFANKSDQLVMHFSEDLGFEYRSAHNKEEYLENVRWFTQENLTKKSMIFEVFTNGDDESEGLKKMLNLNSNFEKKAKNKLANVIKDIAGEKTLNKIIEIKNGVK